MSSVVIRERDKEGKIVEREGTFIPAAELFFNTPTRGGARVAFRKLRDPIFAERERQRSREIAAIRKERRRQDREQRAAERLIALDGGMEP